MNFTMQFTVSDFIFAYVDVFTKRSISFHIISVFLWRRQNTHRDPICLFQTLSVCACVLSIKEKRRLAIRNAAQQWEGVRAGLELPTNGTKEEVSPENSPAHSPAQTNGLAQEPSPDEPRYTPHDP